MQTFEIDVSSVHQIDCSGFGLQGIEDVDIVHFPVGNPYKNGNRIVDIDERVHLYRRFSATKSCPRKKRKTQIDCGGIECIHHLVQFDANIVVRIKRASNVNENLGKLGINAPIANVVCIRQGAAGNRGSNANMIKLGAKGAQTSFDVSETFPVSQLRKSHGVKLT